MELREWNLRLTAHFSELASRRGNIPIFALEHGLTTDEVDELSKRIRTHVRSYEPWDVHSLAWIVYAAEIGYQYAGEEYWQTFETKTPGWAEHGNRGWIRDSYAAFKKEYAGAEPSGVWANQFSIICWPITHAILPRDLQQQLARILFQLRHSFSGELLQSPLRLGEFIASKSWHTSTRFQNLAQEPALIGQIAAALLLQSEEESNILIHPMTLKRIGEDVAREQRGREWLRDARRAAEERAKIHGLALARPLVTHTQQRNGPPEETLRLGIEPRLILRPRSASSWEVSLEVPDLSPLTRRFPKVSEVLIGSRCTVAGAVGRPLARGRCIQGPQRIILAEWPRSDEVLLKFERAEPQLEYLLRTECLLRPGPSWLFKVASDGLAYESRGMQARAGGTYLLLRTTPFTRMELVKSVDLACKGVFGVLLDLPNTLTYEWEHLLHQFQITQAKSIEVWPAGLAAVMWDGEGYGEWVASEHPTLAIRSDHPINGLIVSMVDSGPSLSLAQASPGETLFIELPPLGVGLHKFRVTARSGCGVKDEAIGDLDIVMRVREVRPWLPGVPPQGPLTVEVDPTTPTLEQLWEGKVRLSVHGPTERLMRCKASMFTCIGENPSFVRQLPPIKLPLTEIAWLRYFEKNLRDLDEARQAYDDARTCKIEFLADELGAFTIECERDFTPIRWSIRRSPASIVARLHDDAGRGALTIERYSFECPTLAEQLAPGTEFHVPRSGGLYVATLGDFKASIIIPPIVKGLADLGCEPRIDVQKEPVQAIPTLLANARLWGTARLPGDLLAETRQRAVIRAITFNIISLLGGRAWANAEGHPPTQIELANLKRHISEEGSKQGIGAKLLREYEAIAEAEIVERVALLASLAESYHLVPNSPDANLNYLKWLTEFALRISSDPVTLEAWSGDRLNNGINKLLEVPTLARAARFLVLATGKCKNSVHPREYYAGWGWS